MPEWHEGPLVGLDFETTGVDPLHDVPVQLAVVWCDRDGPRRRNVVLVDPGREIPDEAVAIHGISTERARKEGCSLTKAAVIVHRELFVAECEAVPVVAMNASFDVTIAAAMFRRAGLLPLSWPRVIDPLVIDRHVDRYRRGKRRLENLCEHYRVPLEKAHDAGQDAEAAVALSRLIGATWPEAGRCDPERLTALQSGWHARWAAEFHEWCLAEGRPGLAEEEYRWPVRESPEPVPSQPASESSTKSTSAVVERGFTMATRMATSPP